MPEPEPFDIVGDGAYKNRINEKGLPYTITYYAKLGLCNYLTLYNN